MCVKEDIKKVYFPNPPFDDEAEEMKHTARIGVPAEVVSHAQCREIIGNFVEALYVAVMQLANILYCSPP